MKNCKVQVRPEKELKLVPTFDKDCFEDILKIIDYTKMYDAILAFECSNKDYNRYHIEELNFDFFTIELCKIYENGKIF